VAIETASGFKGPLFESHVSFYYKFVCKYIHICDLNAPLLWLICNHMKSTTIFKTSTNTFKPSTNIVKPSTNILKTSTNIVQTSTNSFKMSTNMYCSNVNNYC
jgi:hypothetical protein